MVRPLATAALAASALLASCPASAFLVVGSSSAQTPGPRTHVVMLREEARTVVAVQSTLRGPTGPLALVVPLQAASATTLHSVPVTLFERTEKLALPRLDELWELDPCQLHPSQQATPPASGTPASGASAAPPSGASDVTTTDGDYQIAILDEATSANATKWLTDRGYQLPEGAESALLAAVKPGVVLAVARIDAARLTFDNGVARLPPLAFVVNGQVSLPLTLTGLGAEGAHEVIVDVLSRRARFEAANRLNLAVPTNLDAREEAKADLDGLYRAVLDHAWDKAPGAVITERAWLAASCDGCAPGTAVGADDLLALGADRLPSAEDGSQREVLVDVPESLARAPEGPPELKRSILACYGKVLADMRGLAGEVTVVVQTGANGEVVSAKTRDASAEALGKCVEDAARATKLDKPNVTDTIKARFALVARAFLGDMVLTRLRARAARGAGGDLELRAGAAIEGGREEGPTGTAEKKVYFAEHTNNFQARYVVRHTWPGPVACEAPKRGIWGPRPKNLPPSPGAAPSAGVTASAAATGSGTPTAASAAERKLAALLASDALPDVQAYAITFRAVEPLEPPATATSAGSAAGPTPPPSGSSAHAQGSGCGCRVASPAETTGAWLAIVAIVAFRRFQRRIR